MRLKLVTRFEELKLGDVVADLRCDCGRFHYGTLTGLIELDDSSEMAFVQSPDCNPNRDPSHFLGISGRTVAKNRIYLVLSDVEDLVGVDLAKVKESLR
jgi:hypothetical protein